ncbi:NmrA-like family [Musa troglodytarum]|uniref:NmrA-like family n=1 Tax=Musa troglodytarum TaxID=320322 RepID=A0A9E7FD42_9LILI|nr:NmrA-like family [Musa troglodytarum]
MALKLSSQLPLSFQKSHNGSQRWPIPHPIPSPNLAGCGRSLLPSGVTSLSRRSGGRGAVHAVKEEETLPSALAEADVSKTPSSSSKLVLVIGGTGGVGQLIVASLLSRNIKSRLLLRDPSKAISLFGIQDENIIEVHKGDTRNPSDLDSTIFEGVTHVICCTGTTAFPSKRWDGDNTPERVDWEGIRNLVLALPPTIERPALCHQLVLQSTMSYHGDGYRHVSFILAYGLASIMNLFGVLKFKKMGEDFVRNSGLPFTIIRAGRLTDGPYTSYDLNTLLKATAGKRRAVMISQGLFVVASLWLSLPALQVCVGLLYVKNEFFQAVVPYMGFLVGFLGETDLEVILRNGRSSLKLLKLIS